jgi:hypothetical protein
MPVSLTTCSLIPMAKPSRFIRDGHTDDLAELLGALEARIHTRDARKALINFAWLLLQARPPRGSDETRKRDRLTAALAKGLTTPGPTRH